ncbi:MAG TPA: hypothetical protein VF490_16070 [Chryseosolibacter sp.]
MRDYQEFTFGWLIFIFAIPIHLLMTYFYIKEMGTRPIGTNGYLVITVILAIICALFYRLKTTISSHAITVSFGIGLIRKRIGLKRIKTVSVVKSPWYYGWGIRIIPNGMLYNISGFDGVELKFNDTGRIIRIGTMDAAALKKEIEQRLV